MKNSKNFIAKILISFFMMNLSISHANDVYCEIFVINEKVGAFFPMENYAGRYEWFKNLNFNDNQEYIWTVEPGNIVDNTFVSNEIAFSFYVGQYNAGKQKKEGKLGDLLLDGRGSIYFLDKKKNESINHFNDKIYALTDEDGVLIFTTNTNTTKFFMSEEPTHAKLSYKTIDKKNNYSCIVKIEIEQ